MAAEYSDDVIKQLGPDDFAGFDEGRGKARLMLTAADEAQLTPSQ